MENDKNINDFFTSAGDTIPELCFIKSLKIYGEDKFPLINKDLVGEPLPDEGIYSGDYDLRKVNEKHLEEALANGESNITIDGVISNINIPVTTSTIRITAELASTTTVDTDTNKLVYLTNTSNEPVDLLKLNAPNVSTVYLSGDFETVKTNTSIKNNEGTISDIIIADDVEKNISVNTAFDSEASITSGTSNNINVNTSSVGSNLTLETPNSKVSLNNGTYGVVTSEVGDNTLVVGTPTIIETLKVVKGNVIVNDVTVENHIHNIINDTTYTVSPATYEVSTWATFKSVATKVGITNVTADLEGTGSVSFPVIGTGNYEWNFGEHNVNAGSSSAGIFFVRGANVKLTINSTGTFTNSANSYGLWVSGGSTVNVIGGTWNAYTHVLYCEKGTINVYGGTFNCLSDDKKFTINCLDANYTAGAAKINCFGGRFIGFNPAESMSEPGDPISFVAEGYKSVEVESGVWEVVAE